jgi:hypothetical protein
MLFHRSRKPSLGSTARVVALLATALLRLHPTAEAQSPGMLASTKRVETHAIRQIEPHCARLTPGTLCSEEMRLGSRRYRVEYAIVYRLEDRRDERGGVLLGSDGKPLKHECPYVELLATDLDASPSSERIVCSEAPWGNPHLTAEMQVVYLADVEWDEASQLLRLATAYVLDDSVTLRVYEAPLSLSSGRLTWERPDFPIADAICRLAPRDKPCFPQRMVFRAEGQNLRSTLERLECGADATMVATFDRQLRTWTIEGGRLWP